VFGVEADIQYADLGGEANWSGYRYRFNAGNDQYFGTVRARAGYAVDRMLIYVTGGLAYGGMSSNWWGGDNSATGWTIGGGVEYAFTNNWTAKIEGLYIDLDQGSHTEIVNYVGGSAVVSSGSRSANNAPSASPSTIPPMADVAEPRAGSRHLVLGERNLGPRGALAENRR
jgi:opacity protein-like surface antigen